MTRLDATIVELWPDKAKILIKTKGLSIKNLKKIFSKIYFPWDMNYNNYRFMYKLQIQELPLFIIVPQDEFEICNLLNLAFVEKLTLRIIAGRHSSNIQNPDFYVDMSDFNKIVSDKNILTVGGGINQGNVYKYLFDNNSKYHFVHGVKTCHPLYSHSLSHMLNNFIESNEVFPGGSAGSVCVTGFTSGGGVGSLRRSFGLAIDNVISYQIIIPPNKHNKKAKSLHICKKTNPDLFWALSGGVASNFGVVSKIIYKMPRINNIVMYSIVWPWKCAKKVLTLWLKTASQRSNQYNEDISMHTYLGKSSISLGGLYVIPNGQTDEEAIKTVIDELTIYGGTLKTKISTYVQTITSLSENRVYHPFSSTQIYFSSNIIDIDFVINQMKIARKINGLCLFGIELLGGKISNIPSSNTAFYPRTAKFFYELFAYCASSSDVSNISFWVKSVFDRIYDPETDTIFVGFPIPELKKNHLYAYYGKNKDRLLHIKQKYDTYGVMNYPQGIIV
jgi:Berberine and berberine like